MANYLAFRKHLGIFDKQLQVEHQHAINICRVLSHEPIDFSLDCREYEKESKRKYIDLLTRLYRLQEHGTSSATWKANI